MAWAQYIPLAIDMGMSLFGHDSNSALASYKYSKALQQHQYDLNRKTRQTSFQDTRYSLEQAGYNPLLAVGQQANGGTFGASLNVQDPKSENLQNRLATLSNISQMRLNSAQSQLHQKNAFATVINALNNTNQTNASVANLNAQTFGQNLQNNITSATGMTKALEEIDNLKANTKNQQSQSALNKAQINVSNALARLTGAQTGLVNSQTVGQNSANYIQGRTVQWIQKHPGLSGFGVGAQQLGAPITSAITGLVGLGAGAGFKALANPHRKVGF